MLLLVVSRLLKCGSYLLVSFFSCLAGKVAIPVASLGFSCEGRREVVFGLASFQFHDSFLSTMFMVSTLSRHFLQGLVLASELVCLAPSQTGKLRHLLSCGHAEMPELDG